MVVRIKSPHNLQRALNYNEQKCQKNQAQCIYAGNYLLEPGQMNFHGKMERLQDLIARNERTKKSNTLHISLNFDPSEKLSLNKLSEIAQVYMEKIGFGLQPYLVYEHYDSGHPHIHILTTNIQSDGRRIDTYNIGRNQSEKARKGIEIEYNLVRAQDKKQVQAFTIKPVDVQKVQYGKSETRQSISNILDAVVYRFKYTSLAELNAILRQYNVAADRGSERGIIYASGGLLYRLLDENGNKTGVPIKASLIYNKPTLKTLEKQFKKNEVLRQPDKKKLRNSIDWALSGLPKELNAFIAVLQKDKIQTVLRQNKDGLIYGITFIDYRTKTVCNGSDIGKQYSIAGIESRINGNRKHPVTQQQSAPTHWQTREKKPIRTQQEKVDTRINDGLIKDLMEHEKNWNRIPGELLKKKKKKRNKNV